MFKAECLAQTDFSCSNSLTSSGIIRVGALCAMTESVSFRTMSSAARLSINERIAITRMWIKSMNVFSASTWTHHCANLRWSFKHYKHVMTLNYHNACLNSLAALIICVQHDIEHVHAWLQVTMLIPCANRQIKWMYMYIHIIFKMIAFRTHFIIGMSYAQQHMQRIQNIHAHTHTHN